MTGTATGYEAALRLRVVRSRATDLAGRVLELGGRGTVWLGRDESNEIAIPDPSMSRHHGWLEVAADGAVVLHDNDSTNGVFLAGRRVGSAPLVPGSRFRMGTTTFELVLDTGGDGETGFEPGRTVMIQDVGELLAPREQAVPLEELGERRVAAANQPFLMVDASSVWLVESGKVEIFTVPVDKGRPAGARSHFLTVEPGSAMFGLDAETGGFDYGFLASGRAGSELRRFSLERLQLHSSSPAYRERLAAIVDGWVAGCSRRLTSDLPRVAEAKLLLRPQEEVELEPETVTASVREVLWIELPAGRVLFDGMASMSYESEGVLFPVAPGSWLELLASEGPSQVLPRRTLDVIDDSRLWAGLALFHRVLMECELLNKRLAIVDEYQRQQRKAERAEEAREVAVAEIEAVLGGTRSWRRPSPEGSELGPTFEACAEVAEHLGIRIERPASELEDLGFEEMIQAIAAESRFRLRQITLVDDWWAQDQGPLVGQLSEGGKPVALIPAGAGVYRFRDPESDHSRILDEGAAAGFEPFAYSFYRTFPDGIVTVTSLLRFAIHGLKREFREVAAMAVGVGLLSTAMPAITGMVFDSAIPEAERPLLVQLCLGLFLAAVCMSAFKITQNVAMLRVQGKMDYSGQAAVWDRLLNLPTTFFRRFSAGDLADRADAVNEIRGVVAGTGVAALLGSVASLFNAVQMCFYSLTLALVGISLTVLYVSLTAVCSFLKLRMQRIEMAQRGGIAGLVLQLISGVGKLRVSGSEDYAFRVWASDFASLRRTAFRVGTIGNFIPVLNSGFPVLSSLAIFFTLYKLHQQAAEKGEALGISTGEFLAFTAAFGIFLAAMQALGEAAVDSLRIVPVWERLRPILEEAPEVDGSKIAPARLRGAIELSNVYFKYGEAGPEILSGLSLKIEPGEYVAFVGGSGCGKSTLMKVMLGFERPQKGSVYYDGQDLATLDVRRVRQQIGVVLQESRLIPADIFRNIVGNTSRTIEEAWEAAHRAGLAEDINRMPMQMHTYVSEGGGGFSGGQKQRLMIARALVHSPKVLYLDEATSALDNRTQAIVTESLDRLQATRIVIAHRLSTIIGADKICYLKDGVIAEQGTYEELMELDGLFAELARRQLA